MFKYLKRAIKTWQYARMYGASRRIALCIILRRKSEWRYFYLAPRSWWDD